MMTKNLFLKVFDIYELPGQSYWRLNELIKLRKLNAQNNFPHPILEIGCGDGVFSSFIFNHIDDAIDVNPNAIERSKTLNGFYKNLYLMDARNLQFAEETFETVFANCVLEHIPDVFTVIKSSHKVMKKGGRFITTVPLLEMNNHLLLNSTKYTELRKYQLSHRNLFQAEDWKKMFIDVGFSNIEIFPYLSGDQCHLWDSLDFPISIGFKRYTVGNAIRLFSRVLPKPLIKKIRSSILNLILKKNQKLEKHNPCAIVIIAEK